MVAAFEWVLYGSHFAAHGRVWLKGDIETCVPELKINDQQKEKKHTMKVMAFNGMAFKENTKLNNAN